MNASKTIAFIASLAAIFLPNVGGSSPFIISDDRVRSLDISPVLGRGYSIMTNSYQSTCLIVEQTTVPSFNYDYFFTDFTSSSDSEKEMSGKISATYSYAMVAFEVNSSVGATSKVAAQSRAITSTMKIERYYSSVREEVSPLSNDAFTLLEDQDYVGFFKACGPNYIRGIRRAQEVTAIFKFTSKDTATAKSFGMGLKVSHPIYGSAKSSMTQKSKFRTTSDSLIIKIVGYGLGLTQEGSETLVAQTIEDYDKVMKFSFKTMTLNDDSHKIGMVYGMEVVPWVNNVAFQVAAKIGDENILLPMPRSMIQKSFRKKDTKDYNFVSKERDSFRCKADYFLIDKYGYCCEPGQLFDPVKADYSITCAETDCVCRPIQNLDRALVKDNMANNAEFTARLQDALRYKFIQIGSLEKCLAASNSIPSKFNYNILKSLDFVKYDKDISTKITLLQLKRAIDPLGNYGIIKQLGREMDEWIDMYYSPCLAALHGTNVGQTPDTDRPYFMSYPWYSHPECMAMTCLSNGMRWDRKRGRGCVLGILYTPGAENYGNGDAENNKYCAKDNEGDGTLNQETCRFDSKELHTLHTDVFKCYNNTQSNDISGVAYLIDNFCNPQITSEELDEEEKKDLKTKMTANCKGAIL